MARMHARRKGKSGSHPPQWTKNPNWVTYGSEQIENLIITKAKEGLTPALIGLVLRDQYGIPDTKKLTGKSVTTVMRENSLTKALPQDLLNLISKAFNLRNHLSTHTRDKHSRRGLNLIEAKIRRLVKYYRRSHAIAVDFKYDYKRASLYLR